MRLIKSLFAAITVTIMTAAAVSTISHLINETDSVDEGIASLKHLMGITVHAAEVQGNEEDIQLSANHTSTTSLNTQTPSTVIDETYLPTPLNEMSQSPSEEENEESTYVDILEGLVPISGEDIDYETVLGISQEKIKAILKHSDKDIWAIAEDEGEVKLLENTYYAVYPARIISLVTDGTITQETADTLIASAMKAIAAHQNTSIELMIQEIANQD